MAAQAHRPLPAGVDDPAGVAAALAASGFGDGEQIVAIVREVGGRDADAVEPPAEAVRGAVLPTVARTASPLTRIARLTGPGPVAAASTAGPARPLGRR